MPKFAACLMVLVIAVLAVGCKSDKKATATPTSAGAAASATPQAQRQATTPPTTQSVCLTNPDPATNTTSSSQFGYRVVSAPVANATVQSPLTVTGQANPFEGAYGVAIFDATGNQIASQNYNKSNLQLAFTAQLPFTVTSSTPACVWVFERSGQNGSPINITQIAVTLSP